MKNIFFRIVPVRVMEAMHRSDESAMITIIKKADTTYHHGHKIFKKFKNEGIITSRKSGRTVQVKLTDKGRRLQELILGITEVVR